MQSFSRNSTSKLHHTYNETRHLGFLQDACHYDGLVCMADLSSPHREDGRAYSSAGRTTGVGGGLSRSRMLRFESELSEGDDFCVHDHELIDYCNDVKRNVDRRQ